MDETKLGYAFAATGGALYVVCTALSAVAPAAYAYAFQSAFHAANVSAKPFDLNLAIVGLAVTIIAAFATGCVGAWFYNYFKPGK